MVGVEEVGKGRDRLSSGLGSRTDSKCNMVINCEGSFASMLSFV